ncbi:MAG: nif-specific transcriptional activator NifA [Spirochaetae bacterium HGW-Spirochaetae-4]|nr:MAG: nif-specific transcriptional activator NifA [Spirochaetes bacterium GWC2_52_13]PKL10666.1 MAG: nif-specific transcriptional activator NifA [Spirochaetae bacterium HGW-Spirochaetae-8]PKL22399.1 MAG: nif-specific transcriptional activator NifA [Spirochaetae bacterium HGW-Spirochaetae-4]HCG63269.1 nif-specific transcriptional activator NifA [Sphaerochaeta sp.]HCS36287.1 nif-specific transcriptional activator NifA [Sphaerochaeta sp.]
MKHANELQVLYEISKILDETKDLKEILHPILSSLTEHTPIVRGAITLMNRDTRMIMIESAYGLTEAQKKRGRYRMGEGITGSVVQSGVHVIIPDVSKDRRYINKTGAETELIKKNKRISFICVPIRSDNETLGTLNVSFIDIPDIDLDVYFQLLSVIASMVARAVKIRQELREEKERLVAENLRLKEELEERHTPERIIGRSQVMQQLFDLIAQVSKSDATVMIRGESGTGKELVAQEIHDNSMRSRMPFVKVNCAALPENIIESELFGHEKGAFTGAHMLRKGRFELADQGTLFLDEIGELSPQMQVKLLRAVQEQEFERVGGTKTIKINVRIIAATNRNLEDEILKGTFREDLYYRLNVFPLHIPPLRERKSDILLLCDHFIEKYNRKNHCNIKRITSTAIDLLMMYHWPGNVRELENCIERSVILSRDDVIHGYHLPPSLQSAESSNTQFSSTLQQAVDALEKELVADALKHARGNQAKAAQNLGISERIMGLRVEKYNLDPKRYKSKKPTIL